MKMGGLLFLLAALLGIAENARSAPAVNRRDLAETVESAKEVLREIPVDVMAARRLEFGFASAHAYSEAYDCFYAGWPSQMTSAGGRSYCTRPLSLPHYTKYSKDKQDKPFACLSKPNTMACNPMLFGWGEDPSARKGLCVSIASATDRQNASLHCEQQSSALGAKKYDFLDEIQRDPEASAELLQTIEQVKKVCIDGQVNGKPTTQKGSQMCARFIAKLKVIEPKIAKLALPTQNDPPPPGSKRQVSFTELLNSPPETAAPRKDAPAPTQNNSVSFASLMDSGGERLVNRECKICNGENAQVNAPIERKNFQDLMGPLRKSVETTKSSPSGTSDVYAVTTGGNKCLNWMKSSGQDEACYDQLKQEFKSSGRCHRWERIPDSAKTTFKTALFHAEIKAFGWDDGNPRSLKPDEAFDRLRVAFGWSETSPEYTALKTEADKLLPPNQVASRAGRAAFQTTLLKKLKTAFDNGQLKEETDRRAASLLSRNKISDCDFPNKEAFLAGLAAIRKRAPELNGGKSHLVTIVDRTLDKKQERVTSFNMKTGKVIFQGQAGFGDGNGDMQKGGPEKDECSNVGDRNSSPHGVALVKDVRPANNGSFKRGAFLQTQKPDGKGWSYRGVAFHEGSKSGFEGYTSGDRVRLHQKALSTGKPEDVAALLNTISGPIGTPYNFSNNGCISLPEDQLHDWQDTIREGSYAYFHCPQSWIPQNERH